MKAEPQWHPEAALEARSAYLWYSERSRSAGVAFMSELDEALSHIAEAPRRWTSYLHGTRRFVMHRFPFSVGYLEEGGDIMIVAVSHAKRQPGYWRQRHLHGGTSHFD